MTDTNELISKYTDVEKRQTLRFGGRRKVKKTPGKKRTNVLIDKPEPAKRGAKKVHRYGKPKTRRLGAGKHTMRPAMKRTIRKYVEEPVEKANPNHSKQTGQFTSGRGSGSHTAPKKRPANWKGSTEHEEGSGPKRKANPGRDARLARAKKATAKKKAATKPRQSNVEKANPNHSKTTGQFTSGGSGGRKAPRKATSKTGPKKRVGNPNTARKSTARPNGVPADAQKVKVGSSHAYVGKPTTTELHGGGKAKTFTVHTADGSNVGTIQQMGPTSWRSNQRLGGSRRATSKKAMLEVAVKQHESLTNNPQPFIPYD